MTQLFDTGERTRTTSRKYNEPMYSFLNTSAWPSVERVRQFWEGWFAQYDDGKKPGLAARFRSYDDHPHLSAFLELFTFAVLKGAGYEVEIEPPAGSRALEFLASMKERDLKLYAECTATGRRVAEAGADARGADVLDAIDKVPTGRFILGVNFVQRGAAAPPLRDIRQGLVAWLSSLEEKETRRSVWTWEDRGWTIKFWAVPAESDDTDDDGGGLGIIGPRIFDASEHLRLRAAIDRKASKYGSLDEPLLVVTDSTEHQTERDLMTALLGDVLWHVNMVTRDVTVGREPNGVFYDARGPRNVALSAVMHGHFGALSFADNDRSLVLVHHPFASRPLPLGLFPFCEERHFDRETGKLVPASPTMSVGEFFGLPAGWPFFDQDPRRK